MASKKTIYSFIGLPASGKGTQAELLAQRLGIEKPIGIGDLIREVIASESGDPFVAEIKKRYDEGVPQPDSVAIDLLRRRLESSTTSLILDNFPFTKAQADFLNAFVREKNDEFDGPVIIYIKVNPETAIERITLRKVCSECKAVYGATDEMICEKCGGSLIVRSDDNIDIVRARITHYQPKISEVLDYYRKLDHKIYEIDGEKTVAEVTEQIGNII